MAKNLTDVQVRNEVGKPRSGDRWLTESMGRGAGSVALKISGGSASWYYRYSVERRSIYLPLGPYPAVSLAQAREAARTKAAELRNLRNSAGSQADLRAHIRAEHEEKQRQAEEEQRRAEAAEREREDARRYSLEALVTAYADHLIAIGKEESGKDVKRAFARNVSDPLPTIAATPAHKVTRRDVTRVLRRIVEDGKGRTAGKLRSYLRAAYALALRAEGDASAPLTLADFGVETNPAADTASLSQYIRPRERVLSESEFRALWTRLQEEEGVAADAARLLILLGGQRASQLVRARVEHFDPDAGTLTLFDPKGRRTTPRQHVVPTPPSALSVLQQLTKRAEALDTDYLLTSTGNVPLYPNTVGNVIRDIQKVMMKEGEAAAAFQFRDIRRTIETRLAALGVSSDIRGQLQSHGLGGIQARHYDRHSYLEEKRRALTTWVAWLGKK